VATPLTLPLGERDVLAALLREPRLERAIGVIYQPQTERQSHWFGASAARQYDALVHIDSTRAVEPLEHTPTWELAEPPETYPTSL
jgi:erythromycin esterase-like protein